MLLVTGQDDEEINKHWMSCVVPRPIGWISTLGNDGVPNLAPYSFFQRAIGKSADCDVWLQWPTCSRRKRYCQKHP